MSVEPLVSRARLELERAKVLIRSAWRALLVRLPFGGSSPANDNRKRWGRE